MGLSEINVFIMKTLLSYLTVIFLLTSCSFSRPITQTPSKKIKSDEYIITSDVGHKIKVEIEYTALTRSRSFGDCIDGCRVAYILTNIGKSDLLERGDYYYKGKPISVGKVRELQVHNVDEFVKIIEYSPCIVFEIKTSDGKVIEKKVNIYDDILIGKSSIPKVVRAEVSYKSDRYCISFKPIRIQHSR